MKIISVDIFMLKHGATYAPYPVKPVICRVNTDEGLYGYGEAGISTGLGENAVFGMLKDLAPLLIGLDPFNNEVFFEDVKDRMYGHLAGGGVIVWSALSALDTAMMDIKGKALGVPCYKLLGGLFNETLPVYASHVQCGWGNDIRPLAKDQEYGQVAKKLVDLGYKMAKFDFAAFDREGQLVPRKISSHYLNKKDFFNMIEERIEAIRNSVGDELDIYIDDLCRLDINGTLEMDNLCMKYDCKMIEECIDPFDISSYKYVGKKCKIPLAAGEKIHTRWGFSEYLHEHILHIIQPDISNCGGLSEAKKICDMAHVYNTKVQVHCCGSPIGIASTLQLEAAIPNFAVHEHFFFNDLPDIKEYCVYEYPVVNGEIRVPDLPGIGNELSNKAIGEALLRITIS